MALSIINAVFAHPALRWLDGDYFPQGEEVIRKGEKIDRWHRYFPFVFLHVGCLAAFWVGASSIAVAVAVILYWVRMFAITGFYHRYFSHKTFKTSRLAQFLFACWGLTCIQRGPLWWAAHHRHHHPHSDLENDTHSPNRGFWWSHIGWIACDANMPTHYGLLKDFAAYPELRLLNRLDWLGPLALALTLYITGDWLKQAYPALGTNGLQFLVWGFFISSTVLFHGTCTINSFSHMIGSQRYNTGDRSRNNWLLAIITMGEGWHNNHHHYPNTVKQGFYWWEIDVTYYLLKGMAACGIIWDLKPVPRWVIENHPSKSPKGVQASEVTA